MNDDGVEVINVGNEYVLHIFERLDGEGTGEVCVHGSSIGVG